MVDGFDDWDDFDFVIDDMLDHDDLDEEEEEQVAFDDLDDADGFDDGLEEETEAFLGGGFETPRPRPAPSGSGSANGLAARPAHRDGGTSMSWSAWDVGAVFALGGWLLDDHAQQVGERVRAALAESPTTRYPVSGSRGAPHPAPPSGLRYSAEVGTHRVGGPLVAGWVHTELVSALARGQSLLVQAEGDAPAGGRLALTVSAVPATGGPRLWVVAEERPGGFSAVRLVPVFQRDAAGGLAVFATDDPVEATDAVVWACSRENVAPVQLEVVRRA